MAQQKINIKIDQAGGVNWDAEGFVGTQCEDATKVFDQAFAGSSRKSDEKPEYYEAESVSGSMQKERF